MKKLSTPKLILDTPYGGNTPCELFVSQYQSNGNTAISALSLTGEPLMKLTTNLDRLPPYQFAVKDWSENEGAVEWLEENAIAKSIGVAVAGFELATIMEFNSPYYEEFI